MKALKKVLATALIGSSLAASSSAFAVTAQQAQALRSAAQTAKFYVDRARSRLHRAPAENTVLMAGHLATAGSRIGSASNQADQILSVLAINPTFASQLFGSACIQFSSARVALSQALSAAIQPPIDGLEELSKADVEIGKQAIDDGKVNAGCP